MVNAQDWLDTNYPKEGRDKVKRLNISIKSLEGKLKIEYFPNLEILDCSRNPIQNIELNNLPKLEVFWGFKCLFTDISVVGCPKIKIFSIAENSLQNLNFINELNPEPLVLLSIRDNDFFSQDLSIFSRFINLQSLYIGNLGKRQNSHEHNKFHGSLEPLKNLTKLQELNIGSTDINSGLEYLSDSLQWIYCNNFKKDAECMKLREKLKDFLDNDQHGGTYDFQLWKDASKKIEAKTIEKILQKDTSVTQKIEDNTEETSSQTHYFLETAKKTDR